MWWEILDLSSEADQKAIKLAYAKKLKQTRPDENPEGFKVLHEAYQQALAWYATKDHYEVDEYDEDQSAFTTSTNHFNQTAGVANEEEISSRAELPSKFTTTDHKNKSTQTAYLEQPQATSELESKPLQATVLKAPVINKQLEAEELKTVVLPTSINLEQPAVTLQKPTTNQTQALVQDPIDKTEQQFAADWRSFQQQFSINLHTETARKTPKDWFFLEQLPSFVDLEFRERLSHELFAHISEANLKATEQKTLFIKAPVLQYLNQLFSWELQWRHLTEQYGEKQADAILLHIEALNPLPKLKTRIQPEELHYYSRFLAFVIDLSFLLALSFFGNVVLKMDYNQELGFNPYPLILGLLIIPFMEASSWQGSLGKRVMHLKVVNNQGQRLNLAHAYWRFILTLVCIFAFKIVVWINLILAYKRNMLLQDWISQSYVIKKT